MLLFCENETVVRAACDSLARTQFDDQLGLNRNRHVLGRRQTTNHSFGEIGLADRQEVWHVTPTFGHRSTDQIEAFGPIFHADDVTHVDKLASHIDPPTVDGYMAVIDHLAGLTATLAKAQAMDHVI